VLVLLVVIAFGDQGSGSTSPRSMSRIGGCPPCSGIHAAAQAGQVTRGSMAVVAIWRSREDLAARLAGGLLAARCG